MSERVCEWNASLYQDRHEFVWRYGSELIELLNPKPGERILDLGCGTGQLTSKIAATAATAIGIDNSPHMVERAIQNYPELEFIVADGADFYFDSPFDAVFSNAALHWMKQPKSVIDRVWKSLKPGGRFVAEFGGKGNVRRVVKAIETVLDRAGYPVKPDANPWYFPSIGEYATLLEERGFSVTLAVLFDRPTRLEAGEEGIDTWLEMFGNAWLFVVSDVSEKRAIERRIKELLKPVLYQNDAWFVDYKRLRIVAEKS